MAYRGGDRVYQPWNVCSTVTQSKLLPKHAEELLPVDIFKRWNNLKCQGKQIGDRLGEF